MPSLTPLRSPAHATSRSLAPPVAKTPGHEDHHNQRDNLSVPLDNIFLRWCQSGDHGRSAQSGFGRVTWRRRTATSCRRTKISTSLEVSLRASSASQPNNRTMSR